MGSCLITSLLSFLGSLLIVSAQSCYYPNGNPSPNDVPCFSGSDEGPCCPQGWKCLSNGLCNLPDQNYLGRYTCTDKSWQSSGCPNLCTQGNTAAGAEAILECSKGNYCCDTNRPDVGCCDTTEERFQLPDGHLVGSMDSPSPISSSQPSATSQSGASATSAAANPGNEDPKSSLVKGDQGTSFVLVTSVVTKNSGSPSLITTSIPGSAVPVDDKTPPTAGPPPSNNHLATILGPAIGIPVVLIACTVLGLLLWRRRKQKRTRPGSFKYVNPDELAYMYSASDNLPPLTAAKADRPTLLRKITGGLFQNRLSELPGPVSPSEPSELSGEEPKQKDKLFSRPLSELPGSEVSQDPHIQGLDTTKGFKEKKV